MAGSINRIIIGGRLGADPEIRNVSDLKRVAKFPSLHPKAGQMRMANRPSPFNGTQWLSGNLPQSISPGAI